MKRRTKGFTLIELLVVIAIIALLMSILMPSLSKVKDMTRTVICTSQMRSWSQIFYMYAEAYQGKFFNWGNSIAWRSWQTQLRDYYEDTPDILMCPSTGPNKEGSFSATNVSVYEYTSKGAGSSNIDNYYVQIPFQEFPYYKSYGLNNWIQDPPEPCRGCLGNDVAGYWRNINAAREPEEVPMFGGHQGANAAWPHDYDIPPRVEAELPTGTATDSDQMWRFCMDRHNGYACYAMMDGSGTKLGLKQLWTMKWNKTFDQRNRYTLAHPDPDDQTMALWNQDAPWMKAYPVF